MERKNGNCKVLTRESKFCTKETFIERRDEGSDGVFCRDPFSRQSFPEMHQRSPAPRHVLELNKNIEALPTLTHSLLWIFKKNAFNLTTW